MFSIITWPEAEECAGFGEIDVHSSPAQQGVSAAWPSAGPSVKDGGNPLCPNNETQSITEAL